VIVVSDTSPISNLLQIGSLELLHQLFGQIIIPPVDAEVRKLESFSVDITSYSTADWIEIVAPKATEQVAKFMVNLDKGESEAIVVALEQKAEYLLIDERLGTKVAVSEGLQTLGLIGVLMRAKVLDLVKNIRPILTELEEVAGFWINEKLKNKVLDDAGE
jgi:uncharacterized protein